MRFPLDLNSQDLALKPLLDHEAESDHGPILHGTAIPANRVASHTFVNRRVPLRQRASVQKRGAYCDG